MNVFIKDDRTGEISGTTIRTWLVFGLFFVYAMVLAVLLVLVALGVIDTENPRFDTALELLSIIGFLAFGQGGLYLGKRVNEKKPARLPDPERTS